MKRIISLALLSQALFYITPVQAQKTELEKNYEFPSKAKKRTLASAQYDKASKTYNLVYVNPGKKNMFTFEAYSFNDNFELINKSQEELDLEAAKPKYAFIMDEFKEASPVAVLTVDNNMGSQLVIKKGIISRTYDVASHYAGGNFVSSTTYANTKFVEIDKVKPKGIEGKKISLVAYKTDQPKINVTLGTNYGFASSFQSKKSFSEATGDVLVVGMIVPDLMGKNAEKEPTNKFFTIMNFSAQSLDMKSETKFNFDFPKVLAYKEDLPDGDIAMVFAAQGYTNLPGRKDPDGLNYCYMRVNAQGVIKEKINFKSLSSKWAIYGISLQKNGDVYVYGPALEETESYYDKLITKDKYKQFLTMKISGGKVAYYTSTPIEEFETKLKKSPLQKKAEAYACTNFTEDEVIAMSNGEMMIKGQLSYVDKDGRTHYLNLVLLHFDKTGKLKAQYADNRHEDGLAEVVVTPQYLLLSSDNKSLNWVILETKDITTDGKPLRYARIGNIEPSTGNITGLDAFAAKDLYVDPDFPFLQTDKSNLILLSNDKSMKNLSFSKVGLR